MNKCELKEKLNKDNLLTVVDRDGARKNYIDGEKLIENGLRQNAVNVFGVYKDGNEYIAFVTDNERGLPNYIEICQSEEDACKALYERIDTLNYIYIKNKE